MNMSESMSALKPILEKYQFDPTRYHTFLNNGLAYAVVEKSAMFLVNMNNAKSKYANGVANELPHVIDFLSKASLTPIEKKSADEAIAALSNMLPLSKTPTPR